MRRGLGLGRAGLAAALLAAGGLASVAAGGGFVGSAMAAAQPHAWLFGSWTGGLFPPPPHLSTEACLTQPVVIFTRDVVLRASLTDLSYGQRVIETAHTSPGHTDFTFVLPTAPDPSGLLSVANAPPPTSFGCESANVLHVARHSDNEIAFPGCTDFPYPLVRCGAR